MLPAAASVSEHHPVREAEFTDGALRLLIRTGRTPLPRRRLFIAAQSIPLGMVRWSLTLPARSRTMEMQDETSGALLRRCAVRVKDGFTEVKIPAAAMHPIEAAFVKMTCRERRRDCGAPVSDGVVKAGAPTSWRSRAAIPAASFRAPDRKLSAPCGSR
jgi:hypothetical protein